MYFHKMNTILYAYIKYQTLSKLGTEARFLMENKKLFARFIYALHTDYIILMYKSLRISAKWLTYNKEPRAQFSEMMCVVSSCFV